MVRVPPPHPIATFDPQGCDRTVVASYSSIAQQACVCRCRSEEHRQVVRREEAGGAPYHVTMMEPVPHAKQTAFVTFTVNHDANQDSVHWASVDFSPDGRYLLLSTNTNRLHLLDAFSGDQVPRHCHDCSVLAHG